MKHTKTNFYSALAMLVVSSFALLPASHALSPAPDGGYPGGNTAEGQSALLSLTTGDFNTAIGFDSLRTDTTGPLNTAVGAGTLLANTGDQNTATGAGALLSNTTGIQNTATGAFALFSNTTGGINTADGQQALMLNTIGTGNTAVGQQALQNNTGGSANTAVGQEALINSNGAENTAVGAGAMETNTMGFDNTAVGDVALLFNTTGSSNTAIGHDALESTTTGSSNTAVGDHAGASVSTADNVIAIGSPGANVSNSCFIGNIRGTTTAQNDGIPVLIDSHGQLGTVSSSRRYKTDIKRIDRASESILALKPVSFRYKVHKDMKPQFGLIAEDVSEVNPDLVIYDADHKPFTVRYDAVNTMLLNEFLKEHSIVQEQGVMIARQQKQIEALTAGLEKVSAQVQLSKAPLTVSNNEK